MDLGRVDATPAPAGVSVSFVESEWHRISTELESERVVARLADMLDREPSWSDLRLLAGVRDVDLDQTGRLMRLMATRRVLSFLEGETVRDVVDIVGDREPAEVMAERTNRHEVGLALGRSKEQAPFQIAVYRRLVTDFPHVVDAAPQPRTPRPCPRTRRSTTTRRPSSDPTPQPSPHRCRACRHCLGQEAPGVRRGEASYAASS